MQTTFVGDSFTTEEKPTSAKFNAMIGNAGTDASKHVAAKFAELDANINQVKRQIVSVRFSENDISGETWEKAVFSAPQDLDLYKVGIVADSSFGQGSNYSTLSIINKGGEGTANNTVVSKDFDSEITAYDFVDFGSLDSTYKTMSAQDVITLKKTITGSGQALEPFVLIIEYDIDITS